MEKTLHCIKKTLYNNCKEHIGQLTPSEMFVHLSNFGFGRQVIASKAPRFLGDRRV